MNFAREVDDRVVFMHQERVWEQDAPLDALLDELLAQAQAIVAFSYAVTALASA